MNKGERIPKRRAFIRIFSKKDPDNRSALERLGNLYLITNRYEEAKEIYKKLQTSIQKETTFINTALC